MRIFSSWTHRQPSNVYIIQYNFLKIWLYSEIRVIRTSWLWNLRRDAGNANIHNLNYWTGKPNCFLKTICSHIMSYTELSTNWIQTQMIHGFHLSYLSSILNKGLVIRPIRWNLNRISEYPAQYLRWIMSSLPLTVLRSLWYTIIGLLHRPHLYHDLTYWFKFVKNMLSFCWHFIVAENTVGIIIQLRFNCFDIV